MNCIGIPILAFDGGKDSRYDKSLDENYVSDGAEYQIMRPIIHGIKDGAAGQQGNHHNKRNGGANN
jgi:hypothetical protein